MLSYHRILIQFDKHQRGDSLRSYMNVLFGSFLQLVFTVNSAPKPAQVGGVCLIENKNTHSRGLFPIPLYNWLRQSAIMTLKLFVGRLCAFLIIHLYLLSSKVFIAVYSSQMCAFLPIRAL